MINMREIPPKNKTSHQTSSTNFRQLGRSTSGRTSIPIPYTKPVDQESGEHVSFTDNNTFWTHSCLSICVTFIFVMTMTIGIVPL